MSAEDLGGPLEEPHTTKSTGIFANVDPTKLAKDMEAAGWTETAPYGGYENGMQFVSSLKPHTAPAEVTPEATPAVTPEQTPARTTASGEILRLVVEPPVSETALGEAI